MISNDYRSYPLVDTAIGTRLLLGFIADPEAVQRRLPLRWRIAPLPAFEAMGLPEEYQPNLLLAFHHLLLDQDAQGQALSDSGSRFLVYSLLREKDTPNFSFSAKVGQAQLDTSPAVTSFADGRKKKSGEGSRKYRVVSFGCKTEKSVLCIQSTLPFSRLQPSSKTRWSA
jgi:hypothetical protein